MSVPGMNLLSLALTVIAPQTVILYKALPRQQNDRGDWVSPYEQGFPVEGSWQPVDRAKYESLGLDMEKSYFMFYTQEPIRAIEPDASPDLCERDGRKYSTTGGTNWQTIDGWQSALFVDIGKAD